MVYWVVLVVRLCTCGVLGGISSEVVLWCIGWY